MTQINIKVKDINAILRAWDRAPKKLQRGIQLIVQRVAIFASGKVKDVIYRNQGGFPAPKDRPGQRPLVRTGSMVRGIQPSAVSLFQPKAYIRPSSATPYARYVHQGTSRGITPRPFFKVTKRIYEGEINKFFNQEIRNWIKNILK